MPKFGLVFAEKLILFCKGHVLHKVLVYLIGLYIIFILIMNLKMNKKQNRSFRNLIFV